MKFLNLPLPAHLYPLPQFPPFLNLHPLLLYFPPQLLFHLHLSFPLFLLPHLILFFLPVPLDPGWQNHKSEAVQNT